MKSLTLKSYGKVNLGLQVLGKRKDGYHEIETVLTTVDLYDEIILTPSREGIRVRTDHPNLPTDERNLVYQAARLLFKSPYLPPLSKGRKGDFHEGVEIFIRKRIPIGGGLGGGSSNGATVLKGLSDLFQIPLSNGDLMELAKELGSDLPFFLKGGTALATGRGETLQSLSHPLPFWLVIVYPGFPISTPWAYRKLDLTIPHQSLKILVEAIEKGDLSTVASKLNNSFEEVMFRDCPALKVVKERLLCHGALGASLSGSGSSCFGICEDGDSALRIASHFGNNRKWKLERMRSLPVIFEGDSEFIVVVTKTLREV
ncbi:4-(cytidine 5'-diphospho)-2-C-methyl-D-erythritol kinase [candidate division TA06 bacterium]|nr:4-(cytidine 5'-diphospho)-2-C-methyl-D-erythritol kinase [candidate division TA06 bacterium]